MYQVTPRWNIPINAVIVTLIVLCLLSFIHIGSTVALNAFISFSTSGVVSSYMISIACILLKRLRGQALPPCQWSLGRWGTAINAASLLYLFPVFVFLFFPPETPVRPDTMNWAVVMYSGVLLFATGYYLVYGKYYTPPVRLVRRHV